MNYQLHEVKIDLGDGKVISIETGKLAKQAHGSVVVRMGDTMLLCATVSNYESKDVDFLPLTVDYREKYASTGKFPGGFFKREARPSDNEVLTMRLVDRALRPRFPSDYHSDTQVMIQLMSADGEVMPDALAGLAASAALVCSDIPFDGPISEVRCSRIDGKFVINPTFEENEKADIDLMVAGSATSILMVEGEMDEVSESEMVEAIAAAHEAIKVHCKVQLELKAMLDSKKTTRREYEEEESDEALEAEIRTATYDKYYAAASKGAGKDERSDDNRAIADAYKETLDEETLSAKGKLIGKYLHDIHKDAVRDLVIAEGKRMDGRGTADIRPIWSEVGYLPRTHGSAIFTRGETQSLTTLTLGGKMDQQLVDSALESKSDKFMLHYNFPPFSTGEARPIRGVSRREVGHGNLALRALKKVLPSFEECPYTIRLVSEILESNGSSSMATVCAGTLALMDGGVQIKAPVTGIAMGLIANEKTGEYAVLSDILGDEDHLGDMDFKITGTAKGITACQMDIKVKGLSMEVLTEALNQAKEGRLDILDEILKTIDKPNEDYKPFAPRMVSLEVPTDAIGAIIGPGGKIIQEMQKDTNTVITIEEIDGKGMVQISAVNKDDVDRAFKKVKDIAFPPQIEIGEEYEGKVKSIVAFGAFVEILPGQDGLIHISELEWHRVDKVENVLKEGQMVKFKVTGRDPKTGKIKLSRKILLPKPEKQD